MKNALALAALVGMLTCLAGCPLNGENGDQEPVVPEPTPEQSAAAAEQAVKQLYPRAIVGRVLAVDRTSGSAEVDLGAADGVRLGMQVRFLAPSPVEDHGSGSIFHMVRGERRAFVNLSEDRTGAVEHLKVGDLAAVLR